jgi:hypothetical protein
LQRTKEKLLYDFPKNAMVVFILPDKVEREYESPLISFSVSYGICI